MPSKPTSPRSTRKPTPPAEGERRAIRGYSFQYSSGAALIRSALTEGYLGWVRVADPKAGRLDDLQIGRDLRVDAFQMKGSEYSASFTFQNLTRELEDAPPLIAQLADGWKRLSKIYSPLRVVVHLVTNDYPSSKDTLPGAPPPTPSHFAAFIAQVWKPYQEAASDASWMCPATWQSAWDALRSASGLTETEFAAFVRDCQLDFSFNLPDETEDLQALRGALFDTVADDQRIFHLSRQELIQKLGWVGRYEFRNRHDFPVDQSLYQPIEETVSHLEQALIDLPGGYISLLGTPGSGKSSLLTQSLRPRPNRRVVRYYAYIPDAQDPASLRGESISFLHDVTLALEHAGFRHGDLRQNPERAELLELFHRQLGLLNEDWKKTKNSTIILVDGLDYIPREQTPVRSLLADLPTPNQIPEGVYIVVGSQTSHLNDLPSKVRREIENPKRTIEMAPLKREAVFRIADTMKMPFHLDTGIRESLYLRSGGHPLALSYLLNRLCSITGAEEASHVLDSAKAYGGNIRDLYEDYWDDIKNEKPLIELLGLLARIRRDIDMRWVRTWANSSILENLRQRTACYFRIEGDRWHFFHNSFRLFLVEKTSEFFGTYDANIDTSYHLILAGHCQNSPPESHWRWEELYHRVEGRQLQKALSLGTQSEFREQMYSLRPVEAILTDIQVALRVACDTQDVVAFTRLVLAGTEMAERNAHLNNHPLWLSLLFALGHEESALEALRDGNRLRVQPQTALDFCPQLKSRGLKEEARVLFELSQPLDILDPSAPPLDWRQDTDNFTLLYAWCRAAIYFRPIKEIIELIRQQSAKQDRSEGLTKQRATRILQNNLFGTLGMALIESSLWEGFEEVLKAINPLDTDCLVYLYSQAWRKQESIGNYIQAAIWIKKAVSQFGRRNLSTSARIALAEGIFRIQKDAYKAQLLVKEIPIPRLPQIVGVEVGFRPFQPLFIWRRLLHTLGDLTSPNEAIHDAADYRDQGLVHFQRAICVVADIWGEVWRGERMDLASLRQHIDEPLRVFHRDWSETRPWYSWFNAEQAREEFYSLLVEGVAQHGAEAIDMLCTEFSEIWRNPKTVAYWPVDVIRAILCAVLRQESRRDWVIDELLFLETRMLDGQDITGRVKQYLEQADVWRLLGEKERALEQFRGAMKGSFGIGYRKDYQMDAWISWLEKTNALVPQNAPERISWFARAIVTLEETTEGKAPHYASCSLLTTCLHWSPQQTVRLFEWLLQKGVLWHADALCAILEEAVQISPDTWRLALVCFRHIALPVCTKARPALLSEIIKAANINAGNSDVLQVARDIVSSVSILALPSTRKEWLDGISTITEIVDCSIEDVGILPEHNAVPEEKFIHQEELRLQDGAKLSLNEVKAQVGSLSDITNLMSQQKNGSAFSWSLVVANVITSQGIVDIQRFKETLPTVTRHSDILNVLAGRLQNLGSNELAWGIRLEALQLSHAIGWARGYDGGARLDAVRGILDCDKAKGRPLVFDQITHDISSQQIPFRFIAEALNDILPLLTDTLEVLAIAPCIDEYVRQLFGNNALPEDDLMDKITAPLCGTDDIGNALAELIMFHIGHSIIPLAEGALLAYTDPLVATCPEVLTALQSTPTKPEAQQIPALVVLDVLSERTPDAIQPLIKAIQECSSSPNYYVQYLADKVGKRIGAKMPEPIISGHDLPQTYKMSTELGRSAIAIGSPAASINEPLPESDNPFDIIAPFNLHLRWIANEANIETDNVIVRCVQIMQVIDTRSNWSVAATKLEMSQYKKVGLQFTYRRRRAQVARLAMFRVVQELIQAGRLKPDSLRRLEPLLCIHDPWYTRVTPIARPRWIEPILGIGQHEVLSAGWLGRISDVFSILKKTLPDDYILLAERTDLRHLSWDVPSERRECVASIVPTEESEFLDPKDTEPFFATTLFCQLSEYPHKILDQTPTPIVVENDARMWDTPGGNWLALNPKLAVFLGWTLDSDVPLRWNNLEGHLMVESLWWMDAHCHWHPPHHGNEVGEGWVVISTPEAYQAIENAYGSLNYVARITRNKNNQPQARIISASF